MLLRVENQNLALLEIHLIATLAAALLFPKIHSGLTTLSNTFLSGAVFWCPFHLKALCLTSLCKESHSGDGFMTTRNCPIFIYIDYQLQQDLFNYVHKLA